LEDSQAIKENPASVVAASMEGKLKEKLESTGIAFLCLSISRMNANPIKNTCKTLFK
jgi:hypothetical protein